MHKTERKHAAIVFTDIVGYTALMGSDEDRAFEVLSKNREIHSKLIEIPKEYKLVSPEVGFHPIPFKSDIHEVFEGNNVLEDIIISSILSNVSLH